MMTKSEKVTWQRWLMAGACALIAFCNIGMYRSSSVLYVEMIRTFGVSRESASWPFSLFGAVSSFIGIIPGMLSEYFAVYQFAMFGAFLSTLGVVLCFFAHTTNMVTICFGVVAGFGSGLIMTLLPVTLNQTFKTDRATANGIFLSGATVSLMVLPPLTEWLIEIFCLRGTFLLLGGLVLNVFVGAFLIRLCSAEEQKINDNRISNEDLKVTKFNGIAERMPYSGNALPEESNNLLQFKQQNDLSSDSDCKTKRCPIMNVTPSEVDDLKLILPETQHEEATYEKAPPEDCKFLNCNLIGKGFSEQQFQKPQNQTCHGKWRERDCVENQLSEYRDLMCQVNLNEKGEDYPKRKCYTKKMRECLSPLFDPMFLLITFCSVTTRTVVVTVTLILVDYLMDKGETETQGVVVASLVAIPELIGRLGSGWISDRGFIKRKYVFLMAEVTSGVALFLLTCVESRVCIFILCAIFALTNGGAFILVNVFYLEYLGVERLPVALGLKNIFMGLASLARPWLIGFFRDNNVRSYDYLLYGLGAVSVLAGGIWFFEPIIMKIRTKNTNKIETSKTEPITVKAEEK